MTDDVCPEISVRSKKKEITIATLVIQQLKLLTVINVSGCKITNQGADMVAAILLETVSLEKLDISDTTLNEVKGDKIRSALKSISSLKVLNMSNNFIASKHLVIALTECPTLEELNVSQNLLMFSNVVKIAQSFRHHAILKALDLSGNKISFSTACEFIVDVILSVNQKLTYLNICGRNIRPRFVDDYLSPPSCENDSSGFVLQDLYLLQHFPLNNYTYTKLIKVVETCPISKENVISYYVDHKGSVFYHHYNFVIFVPPGAVSQGQCVEIQASASHFGPYEIPAGFYPISNFVWISANYRFKIPVYVVMSHHAKIRSLEDVNCLSVLQTCGSNVAGEKYMMTKISDGVFFDYEIGYCVLATDHFCSYSQAKNNENVPEFLTAFYYTYDVSYNSHIVEVCFSKSNCQDCEKVCCYITMNRYINY